MIVIGTPTRDVIDAGTASDVAEVLRATPGSRWAIAKGSLLSNLRTELVNTARSADASHILFVDSDMRLPADTAQRLVARREAIVGANCVQRSGVGSSAWKAGDHVRPGVGVEYVDSLGFGVTLIRVDVFEKVPEPWFAMPWDRVLRRHVGEDVYFSTMAREYGFKIAVDHDLSADVRHIGPFEYRL